MKIIRDILVVPAVLITILLIYFIIDTVWSWVYSTWGVLVLFFFAGTIGLLSGVAVSMVSKIAVHRVVAIIAAIIGTLFFTIEHLYIVWTSDYKNSSIVSNIIASIYLLFLGYFLIFGSTYEDD